MPATVSIIVNQSSSGGAIADVKKDLGDLGSSAKDAGGGFSALGEIGIGALRAIGEAATNAAIGGLKALGGAVMDGISDARENAQIQAQTAATIKSMGNAAGVSAEHVASFASSLSAAAGKSLFGDDQIQQSTNMLLTFGNLKGATLDLATALSVDMAQTLHKVPQDMSMMIGKLLNSSDAMAAAKKMGVSFTDEQIKMGKAMFESGDIAGYQTLVMNELNKEFGGSAEAAAKADGGMAQFKDRIGEAKEAIGTALLPLLGQMAGFLNDTIAPAVETAAAAFSAWLADPQTQAGIQAITQAIGVGLAAAFSFLTDTLIPALLAGWAALQPAIELVRGALSGVATSFSDSSTPIQGFLDTLSQISPMFAVVRGIVEAALPPIQAIIMSVFGIISGFIQEHGAKIQSDLTAAWTAIQGLIAALLPPIQAIVQAVFGAIAMFLQAHGEEIKTFLGQTWDTIAQIVILAVQLIQATIVPIFQAIAGFLSAHGTEIQGILTFVWETIKTIITTALGVIKGILTTALALVKGDWQGAWDGIHGIAVTFWEGIKTLFTLQLNIVKGIFTGVWDAIKIYFQGILDGLVGWVVQTMTGIGNGIRGAASALNGAAGAVAEGIVSGISKGISDGASKIIDAAKDAAMAALNAAKSALGIGSPSKLFASEIGKPMAQGMAVGLAGGAGMVATAAQYTAGAALAGGSSVADSYNRSVTMNISNNLSGTEGLDYSLAASLAGV